MPDVFHSIKAVALQTGLSTHVIRVWEKRYGAVRPVRSESNRRVYSSSEVRRLELLRRATELGHSIGNIARLAPESLAKLLENQPPASNEGTTVSKPTSSGSNGSNGGIDTHKLLETCMVHIRNLDHLGLEQVLVTAMVSLGHQGLLQRLVAPLAFRIGEEWRLGDLKVAHEHFASAVIRTFLWSASRPFSPSDSSPNLIVATPSGQHHELGAVMVAAVARNRGWHVTYLGTCLPAAEIAGAAIQNGSKAVLLSVVYPEDDANLPAELRNLRKLLPNEVKILVGGRASVGYSECLAEIGAVVMGDLQTLYPSLDAIRSRGH